MEHAQAPAIEAGRRYARQLAAESIARGDPTGWFEPRYAAAEQGATTVPWADLAPYPGLVSALGGVPGRGRALVVGCGLGDDAEHVASLGFTTVAFDVSPTAIASARRRFTRSAVEYVTADLLSPPGSGRAFDLVVDVFTLQVLTGGAPRKSPGWSRPAADCCSSLARDEHEDPGQMPWPLTRAEIESFRRYGLAEQFIGDFLDDGLVRRWRAWFTLPVPPDLLANP